MTRSPFPKSFFAPGNARRRAAFRDSARTVAAWRRAAEADDYYLIEKPPLVKNSGVWSLHADFHRFRNRAGARLALRDDFAAIERAHRRAWLQMETPGVLDTSALDSLRLRVGKLERIAGLA